MKKKCKVCRGSGKVLKCVELTTETNKGKIISRPKTIECTCDFCGGSGWISK